MSLHNSDFAALAIIERTKRATLSAWVDMLEDKPPMSFVVQCLEHGTETNETADEETARRYYNDPRLFCVHCKHGAPAIDWKPKPSEFVQALRDMQREAGRVVVTQSSAGFRVEQKPFTDEEIDRRVQRGSFADFIGGLDIE